MAIASFFVFAGILCTKKEIYAGNRKNKDLALPLGELARRMA
jgi:hypothetical protein